MFFLVFFFQLLRDVGDVGDVDGVVGVGRGHGLTDLDVDGVDAAVQRPRAYTVHVCMSASVCVCVSLCVSLCVCLCVSLCASVCVCVASLA